MGGELEFRGVKGRTFEDQARAIDAGYNSIVEYAVDELGLMVVELVKRMDRLEEQIAGLNRLPVPANSVGTR